MDDLRQIGLDVSVLDVYRGLVSHRDWGVDDIARALGMTADSVRIALDRLLELDLLHSMGHGYRAVDPRIGLAALVQRRLAEVADQAARLERIRLQASVLADELVEDGLGHEQLTTLVGLDRVRSELEAIAAECTTEMCTFQPNGPQAHDLLEAAKPLDRHTVSRGVQIRSLYVDAAVHDGPTRDYLHWLRGIGAAVRSVPSLPMRMIIVDRSRAILPMRPTDSALGAVLVTHPGIVQALLALFDVHWQAARELADPQQRPDVDRMGSRDRAIVRLLAAGAKDEAVARSLGVSVRTARRFIADLMTRLEVSGRFEAGVAAAKRGWV